MGKKLKTFVTVHDENFVAHTFGPGEKVPAWAKKAITNPNVWAEDEATHGDEDDESENEGENGEESATGSSTDSSDATMPALPPRGGAGSGADAWRAYGAAASKAKGLEIDIPADATKTDIIEALKSVDIPVE